MEAGNTISEHHSGRSTEIDHSLDNLHVRDADESSNIRDRSEQLSALHLYSKSPVSDDKCVYVFDIDVNRDLNAIIAASLSNFNIQLFCSETLKKTVCLKGHQNIITGLRFRHIAPHQLLSSSTDGSVCLWDIREASDKPSQSFQDLSEGKFKPLSCFDIDVSENYICAGTELVKEDVFLLFWDVRSSKLLGGYWDTHTDDITQVKFHPQKKDCMVSGSTDGLINVFDISQESEEDALLNTLNTGSTVGKLNWICEDADRLSCITHTEDLQLWNINEPQPASVFFREKMRNSQQTDFTLDYMTDTFHAAGCVHLVTGSTNGLGHIWRISNEDLSLCTLLEGGHTDVVRTVCWYSQTLITGGEDGNLCIWKPELQNFTDSICPSVSAKRKAASHMKKKAFVHTSKPY